MPIAAPLPFPDPTPGQQRGPLTPNNAAYYQPGGAGYSSTFSAPNNAFPQVLGASTTGQANGQGPVLTPLPPPPAAAPATPSAPAASAAPNTSSVLNTGTQGINDNFNTYASGIDQLRSGLDKQIQDLQSGVGSLSDQINGQYGTNLNSLNSQQNQANQSVATNQAASIRDLEDNLRSQYAAANRQLGSVGAGDSSAVGQYAQAIADQGSKARAQLMMQAQQLHGQIGQQFSDQLNQLNGWKSNQVLTLVNQFKSQQQQLDQSKIGANQQKVEQINALKLQLQQQASAALQQVDSQSSYWNDQLTKQQQAYQDQVAQIHDLVSGPQKIDPTQFQALGNKALQYTGPGGANGMTVQSQPVDTSVIGYGLHNGGLKPDDNPNAVQF